MEGIKNKSAAVMSKLKQAKVQEQMEGPPVPSEDLEAFILANELDERAANALRNSGNSVQNQVIKANMTDIRNPSAHIMARIKQAHVEVEMHGPLAPTEDL